MATYRERREAKAQRLKEWAEKRQQKATQLIAATPDSLRHDLAFLSQPGRIPERERMYTRDQRAFENQKVAASMESRADGIEDQLDRSIYSDDPDAVEALRERIAELEAKRERMKAINKAHERFLKNPASLEAANLSDSDKAKVRAYTPAYSWEPHPYPPYAFQNLSGNINRQKKRLVEVEKRAQRSTKAENSGGVLVEGGGEYVRVTFAEKPERDTLAALRGAGFQWGGGSWTGRREKLPAISATTRERPA